jgi:mRNA interferase RelE/StbE
VKVEFKASFSKDLNKIKNKVVLKQIKEAIEGVEKTKDFKSIPNLKKLRGGDTYYRIKVGEYRIGLSVEGDLLVFVRCLDRKDIYRYFP